MTNRKLFAEQVAQRFNVTTQAYNESMRAIAIDIRENFVRPFCMKYGVCYYAARGMQGDYFYEADSSHPDVMNYTQEYFIEKEYILNDLICGSGIVSQFIGDVES